MTLTATRPREQEQYLLAQATMQSPVLPIQKPYTTKVETETATTTGYKSASVWITLNDPADTAMDDKSNSQRSAELLQDYVRALRGLSESLQHWGQSSVLLSSTGLDRWSKIQSAPAMTEAELEETLISPKRESKIVRTRIRYGGRRQPPTWLTDIGD